MTVDISVRRKFVPHAEYPAEAIITGDMTYGAFHNERFEEYQKSSEGYIAYNRNRIGRGIIVRHSPDFSVYTFTLGLPASSEDIEELFTCAYGVMNLLSAVTVNGRPVSKLNLEEVCETLQEYNLKLLHEMMGKVLNGESDFVSIGCARNRLSAGTEEAEQMWAGVNTDVYRDWMHRLQSSDADIAETTLLEHKVTKSVTLLYTVKKDRPFLLPRKPALPVQYYDTETGRPSCQVDRYMICFTGSGEKDVIASADYEAFEEMIPDSKKRYFDAEKWYISGFCADEIRELAAKAVEFKYGKDYPDGTSDSETV
ncbi:MAG: DUF4299 domain-containing protein [Solobacterium sp.]|nr:DUF4299 domain-containing protein [Solobacterium sp.]